MNTNDVAPIAARAAAVKSALIDQGAIADDGLDQQAGQRGGNPQRRQIIERGAERLEDTAHIRILQRKADLDAEKAKTDIDEPRKGLTRFFHLSDPLS